MSNLKRIIPTSLAILTALASVACRATSPSATSVPLPPPTPTPLPSTPLATPTFEVMQMPQLSAPSMEGAIEVSGYKLKLNYKCYGEGSPTIIVEAGAYDRPTLSMSWNAVIQGVYPTTRICIYDRLPVNTAQDGAENLHFLLSSIPLPRPYIVVAHSLGGWYARVFAHLYPEEVAGLILVDPTFTYQEGMMIYATAYPTYSPNESASITENRFSEDAVNTYPPAMASMDGLDMKTSNEQVRQANSFGDIPLVVIGHTPGLIDLKGIDPVIQDQYAAILVKIMADQATLSSRGIFIQAHTHQHFISEYEPQIIIDAIKQMAHEIQNQ